MADIRQTIRYYPFGSKPLTDLAEVKPPPFARNPFQQLHYVQDYLKALGCSTVVIEGHYIDRDHIEDHSAFYSRNFFSYPNYCKRLHFFSLDEADLKQQFTSIVELGKKDPSAYSNACERFSDQAYLGSSVIKPLHGCPVGRTILRTYPKDGTGGKRVFPCIRRHRAHILGVELTIQSIPFQQQDTGVSACATTAIWSALHHFREVEDLAAATPAQITNVASRYSLPFGRSMPSEGLSLEQMCQAIQGLGVSPHLYRATDFATAQSIIHSATMSRISSILIIERTLEDGAIERHAVAVAGIKLTEPFTPIPLDGVAEQSTQLMGAYVHDDRWGPFVSTMLVKNDDERGKLRFLKRGVIAEEENWIITHVLIPTHTKIRLSFSGLQQAAMEVAIQIQLFFRTRLKLSTPDITLGTSILRSHKYVEELLFDQNGFAPNKVEQFSLNVSLPRYVGLVRLENPLFGRIDVLVDTTGTLRNLHCSAVVCRLPAATHAAAVGDFLAKHFDAHPKAFGF